MAGDGEVADLAGHRGVRVVAGRVADVGLGDALDHHPVLVQGAGCRAGRCRGSWSRGRRCRRRGVGPTVGSSPGSLAHCCSSAPARSFCLPPWTTPTPQTSYAANSSTTRPKVIISSPVTRMPDRIARPHGRPGQLGVDALVAVADVLRPQADDPLTAARLRRRGGQLGRARLLRAPAAPRPSRSSCRAPGWPAPRGRAPWDDRRLVDHLGDDGGHVRPRGRCRRDLGDHGGGVDRLRDDRRGVRARLRARVGAAVGPAVTGTSRTVADGVRMPPGARAGAGAAARRRRAAPSGRDRLTCRLR